MRNFDVNYRKKLEKRKELGCLITGFISVLLLKTIGLLINEYYDIVTNEDMYIFILPAIYTFFVEYFLAKAVNDSLIPNKDFFHGIVFGFIFLILKYALIPYIYYYGTISEEYLNNAIGYLVFINIVPNIGYLLIFSGWYYICDIRFKWILRVRGEYDDIIAQHNKEYEEYKKAQREGKVPKGGTKNENADFFDISGGFIKKLSSKFEENIKK